MKGNFTLFNRGINLCDQLTLNGSVLGTLYCSLFIIPHGGIRKVRLNGFNSTMTNSNLGITIPTRGATQRIMGMRRAKRTFSRNINGTLFVTRNLLNPLSHFVANRNLRNGNGVTDNLLRRIGFLVIGGVNLLKVSIRRTRRLTVSNGKSVNQNLGKVTYSHI